MNRRKKMGWIVMGSLLMALTLNACGQSTAQPATHHSASSKVAKPTVQPSLTAWKHSSEKKPYPNMALAKHNYLLVSIKDQRVYVKNPAHQVLYTMLCSTGNHNGTPRGTYRIQAERGAHFYNASSQEGANYWTSWKDHGIYLFHSVPVNQAGHYQMKDAHELGKTANSHGCIRLSIPDAKWINQHVPMGTKVVIK